MLSVPTVSDFQFGEFQEGRARGTGEKWTCLALLLLGGTRIFQVPINSKTVRRLSVATSENLPNNAAASLGKFSSTRDQPGLKQPAVRPACTRPDSSSELYWVVVLRTLRVLITMLIGRHCAPAADAPVDHLPQTVTRPAL